MSGRIADMIEKGTLKLTDILFVVLVSAALVCGAGAVV
jgi:hypothetical protein